MAEERFKPELLRRVHTLVNEARQIAAFYEMPILDDLRAAEKWLAGELNVAPSPQSRTGGDG